MTTGSGSLFGAERGHVLAGKGKLEQAGFCSPGIPHPPYVEQGLSWETTKP